MRTRAGSVRFARVISASMARFLSAWQRNLHLYQGPASRLAADLEGTAEHGCPLPHAGEPDSFAPSAPAHFLVRSEAEPPISNTKPYRSPTPIPHALEHDVRLLGLGVLAHVCQRFLGNPEQGGLYRSRETFFAQRSFVTHFDPFTGTNRLYPMAQRGRKPEVVEGGGPEIVYDAPGLFDRLLEAIYRLVELFGCLDGGLGIHVGEVL